MHSQPRRSGTTPPPPPENHAENPQASHLATSIGLTTSCHIPQPITIPKALPSGEADRAVPSYSFPQLLAPAASHQSKLAVAALRDAMPPSSSGSRRLADGLALCLCSPVSQGEGLDKIILFHSSVFRGAASKSFVPIWMSYAGPFPGHVGSSFVGTKRFSWFSISQSPSLFCHLVDKGSSKWRSKGGHAHCCLHITLTIIANKNGLSARAGRCRSGRQRYWKPTHKVLVKNIENGRMVVI